MVEDEEAKARQAQLELQRMVEYIDEMTAVVMEHDPSLLQEANRRRIEKANSPKVGKIDTLRLNSNMK